LFRIGQRAGSHRRISSKVNPKNRFPIRTNPIFTRSGLYFSYGKQSLGVSPFLRKDLFLFPGVADFSSAFTRPAAGLIKRKTKTIPAFDFSAEDASD
jgi:hypothetical protein